MVTVSAGHAGKGIREGKKVGEDAGQMVDWFTVIMC